jgi:hypothetical protein
LDTADIVCEVVPVLDNPDAIVVLFVKSKMEILLPDIFDGLVVVHVKVFEPAVISAPTSNVVDWPVIAKEPNVGNWYGYRSWSNTSVIGTSTNVDPATIPPSVVGTGEVLV